MPAENYTTDDLLLYVTNLSSDKVEILFNCLPQIAALLEESDPLYLQELYKRT